MTIQYPVKNMLLPRSFVYATNSETLVLQSQTAESRLRFLNSYDTSSFMVSSSNDMFRVSKDSNVIATFNYSQNVPLVSIPTGGRVESPVFEVPASNASRKSVVLTDNNKFSQNQFAGFGYSNGRVVYQAASVTDVHAFHVAQDSASSAELMRIQSTALGSPQVGIGTTAITSNVMLEVAGATRIRGDLTVTGALNFDNTGIVYVDSNTQRISSTVMPQKVLFLNSNNQIDQSYIPQAYNFQFFKAQKNVGIGTRAPLQRFHVNGTSFFSERIGIGTHIPLATLHAVEKYAVIPALRLENNFGGNILEAYCNGSNVFTIYGSPSGQGASIGIGTTLVKPGNVMQVQGNGELSGLFKTSNLDVSATATVASFVLKDNTSNITYLNQQNLVQPDNSTKNTMICNMPFIFNNALSTSTIYSTNSDAYVYVKNTGMRVDGDFIIGSQMFAMSDARLKKNIRPIEDPLEKLDRIHGYTYVKGTSTRREAGVLAQEVQEILPEAIYKTEDDYMAVSYDALVPLLIEAVRELRATVRDLQTRLT